MIKGKSNRFATAGRGRLYNLLVLLSCLVATSCGQKGFPRPEQQGTPPQIKDAHAEVHPRGVELSWTMPDQMPTKTVSGLNKPRTPRSRSAYKASASKRRLLM